MIMGRKENQPQREKNKVQSVLELLRKQAPLTIKQEKFCNNGCVERFLKAKGDSVNKAAKQMRSCLAWRDSIGIDNLIADEFSAELAEGVAYVAGNDDELRPVVIFRIKQDYQKYHSLKLFTRLLVFTLEVAVQTMAKSVEQFVLLYDASFIMSASTFLNMLLGSLKIIADYYPSRLHRAFIIDPPSIFSYLWKGVKPFVELSSSTTLVSALDLEASLDSRAASLRFNPSSSSSSSRFSFTVSHHFDSLKPWYLSLGDNGLSSKVGPTMNHASVGPAISPLYARSYSFDVHRKSFYPSTPMPRRTQEVDPSMIYQPRTPNPSFLKSPALFFRKESQVEKSRQSFVPFLKFYRRPYDEMIYRSKMRPPLGGLISIVSPQLRRNRHISMSQRF